MAAETVVIDIVINSRNNSSAGLEGVRKSSDRVADSVRKTKKELDRLGGTTANPKVSLVDKATSAISKIDRSLSALGRTAIKAPVRIVDYATRPLRAIKNALFSIKGLIVGIGSAWAANKLISNPISVADSYSSAKIGFSNLLGENEGQKMMDDLDAFAKKTPFDTAGVISNAQMMMAMGWDAKDIIKDMETIGNAAAATGKGTTGLEAIVRALSQIKTKGKLSTEELNQLSEQGIAAKAMLAEQLGYGTGDAGIAKMSADLEKGLIGSETAIQALLQGMKQFDGMMDKTANETVEGLKAQISDAFEINVVRRWGQGLQDGAKRGFGKIVELLDKSEGTLEKFGDTVYEIGKELSNWAADKLENTIDKILEITNREDFKDASLFGKAKILWDEIIAEPFSTWWNSKGKPFVAEKAEEFGEALGSGISKALIATSNVILDFLGLDTIDTGESESIGGSFASGFLKGFEGKKVWSAITKAGGAALKSGIKAVFSNGWLGTYVSAVLATKVASGIMKGVNLWYGADNASAGGVFGTSGLGYSGGIKGFLGGASTASGTLEGSGLIGMLAKLGSAAGSKAYTGAGLAAAGGVTAAGIIGGVAGLGNSVVDLTRTIKATSKNDEKLYGTRSATKAGMVAAGAGIGTLIAPGIGTAIGAGLGGIATFLAGNKLADSISGVSKSTAELNEEAEELAKKNMAERFGEITLSAEQLSKRVSEVFGAETISRVDKFNQSMKDLKTISDSTANYRNDVGYTHERITAGEELSESDISSYKSSLENYADSVGQLLEGKKSSSISAFELLYGDDTKGLQKATRRINSTYTKLEKDLSEKTTTLNETIAKAFEDGKIDINEEKAINEIIEQIDKIYDQVEKHIKEKEKAESEAAYSLLEMKYKDSGLTPDSFKTLMSELDKQAETDMQAYDDAYITAKAELDLEFKGKKSSKAYKDALAEIEQKWREGKAITVQQKVNVAFDVLKTNYSSEFDGIKKKLESDELFSTQELKNLSISSRNINMENSLKRIGKSGYQINWGEDAVQEFEAMKDKFLETAGVDPAVQKEMKEMYETLKPQEEDLQELKESYEKAGKEVPQWIEDSLADIANVKLMSGDMDSFYKIVGEQLAKDDPAYGKALKEAKENGQEIPQALIDGVNEGLKNIELDTVDITEAAEKALSTLKDDKLIEIDKSGKVTITADGGIDYDDVDKKTQEALDKLEEEGVIEIDKEGKVTVTANVNTDSAKEKTESETKGALGKDQNVDKTANVEVSSNTNTEPAVLATGNAINFAYANPFSATAKLNASVSPTTPFSTLATNNFSTLKTSFVNKFSAGFSVTVPVTTKISSSTSGKIVEGSSGIPYSDSYLSKNGYTRDSSGKVVKKANGGYIDKAITTLVGEAGPEMIIPLSANRRQRGKYLWERAGRAMGLYGTSSDEKVYANANGGLYGTGASRIGDMLHSATSVNESEETHTNNRSRTVKVEVGGIQISVNSSGKGIKEDISSNLDAISAEIAKAVEMAFQNMPLTVE